MSLISSCIILKNPCVCRHVHTCVKTLVRMCVSTHTRGPPSMSTRSTREEIGSSTMYPDRCLSEVRKSYTESVEIKETQ